MTQQNHQCEKSFADLKQYPTEFKDYHQQIITIGDLHGNTMKLLWLLTYFSIIRFPEPVSNFQRLWEIYETPVEKLSLEMIKEYESIIQSSIIVDERPNKIIFIGDILADRGLNDYFTFIVFQRIYQHIDYSILLSNHDIVHLCEAEGNDYLAQYPKETHENYFISFLNFKKLISKFPELESSAIEMRNTSFKPFVKLFDFGFPNPTTMLLFSHTPFIFNKYFFQLDLFNNTFLNELVFELEQINAKVSEHIKKNKLHLLDANIILAAEHRDFSGTKDNEFLEQGEILNIHGHIGERHNELVLSQSINLDSDLGRTKTSITPEIYQYEFSYYVHKTAPQYKQQKLLITATPDERNYEYISKILMCVNQLESWSSLDPNTSKMKKLFKRLSEHSKLAELHQLITILDDYELLERHLGEVIECKDPAYVFKILYLLFDQIDSEEHVLKVDMTNLFRHQDLKIILSIMYKLSEQGFLTEEFENIGQCFEHPNIMILESILDAYLQNSLISDHELLNHLFQKSTQKIFIDINKILFRKDCLNNQQKLFIHHVICAQEHNLIEPHQHLIEMYNKNLISNKLIRSIPSLDFFSMPMLSLLIKLIPENQQSIAIFAFEHVYPIFNKEQHILKRFQCIDVPKNILSEEDWNRIQKNPQQLLSILDEKFPEKTESTSTFDKRFFSNTQSESNDSASMKKPKLTQAEKSTAFKPIFDF